MVDFSTQRASGMLHSLLPSDRASSAPAGAEKSRKGSVNYKALYKLQSVDYEAFHSYVLAWTVSQSSEELYG